MRALVLSGGGPLAVAWQSGLAAGLARRGVRLGDANFVLGTSAGAIIGSQLAAAIDPEVSTRKILSEADAVRPKGSASQYFTNAVARLPEMFGKALNSVGDPAANRAEVGDYALRAPTESEEVYVTRMAAQLETSEWPARAFGCVAVDVMDGSVKVLDRNCGVPLARAMAASCSLPGLSAPICIGGRRYMDGGLRSSANADLAVGYKAILIISFRSSGPAGERIAARLALQTDQLKGAGTAIHVITPDEACLAAIGPNTMDVIRRPDIARAAIAQGECRSQAVGEFWNGI